MATSTPAVCPACGTPASGKFCAECGSALKQPFCGGCGAALSPGARFCHRCGRPASLSSRGGWTPWIVATSLIVTLVGIIIYEVAVKAPAPVLPDMANNGASAGAAASTGTPPDISQMTPEERFIRLNDRVMTAAEQGDTTTVTRFMPMAFAAYSQLDSANADDRYHAALLHAQVGEYAQAQALADTILAQTPNHLFGWVVRAVVAQAQGNSSALAASRKAFLAHYAAQMKLNRPEYQEHGKALEEFRTEAMKN